MRKHLPVAGALAAFLIALPTAASAQTTQDTTPPGLDEQLLEAKLAEFHDITGYSVIAEVAYEGEDWDGALGPRSIEEPGADTESGDHFRIASLTKSMVAAILLQLQTEGAVDLDGTFSDYLPGLLPYEDEPTIRQAMNHTGGLSDYFSYLYPSLADGDMTDLYEGYQTHYTADELIKIGTQDPLLFEPGTDWSYSNTGYMALGLLIEEVTGNGLDTELRERVWEPAGLEETYLPEPASSGIHEEHPVPYVTTGEADDPLFETEQLSHSQLWAAGGVISTAEEVNDFYGAYLDGTLLTDAELDQAFDFVDVGDGGGYGLGLVRTPGCGEDDPAVGHTGGGLGHTTYSFHTPNSGRQITVTWNLEDAHGYADPEETEAALTGLLVAGMCGVDDPSSGARAFTAPPADMPFLS